MTCTGCASLNASSFVWPFLCYAVAQTQPDCSLHQTTWRETYSGQTRTTRGEDCDWRQLRGCSCVAHDYERSATALSALLHLASKRSARARRHRFGTITGHFQAALKDSSVWTIVRLTTDLVTCPYVRINTVVNNSNNNNIFILYIQALRPN